MYKFEYILPFGDKKWQKIVSFEYYSYEGYNRRKFTAFWR